MTLQDKSQALGGLIVLPVFAAIILGVFMGLPYLYRLSTTPWAGSGPDKLTGIWVGKVNVHRGVTMSPPLGYGEPAGPARQAAVMLNLHLSFWSGTSLVAGSASVCESGKSPVVRTFYKALVTQGAPLFLKMKGDDASELTGNWQQNQLSVKWDLERSDPAYGTLRHGTEAEFQELCHQLR